MRCILWLIMVTIPCSFCFAQQQKVVLWAWEKREDLLWIDPSSTRIAILTATATITEERWRVVHRMNPAWIPPEAKLSRVIRIDTRRALTRHPDPVPFARALYESIRVLPFTEVQIDFDARESERIWYRSVLEALRTLLPSRIRLTMTALASWCIADDWLRNLPVDEIVPMPFRMGRDRLPVLQHLREHGSFTSAQCQSAIGVALDEPIPIPHVKRLYIFNPEPWSRKYSVEIEKIRAKYGH